MQSYEILEREWAEFNELDPAGMVVCSSGTAALHLALETLRERHGWKNGDEVLVPDYTMVACARAVTMAGLTPVFVGCCEDLLINLVPMNKKTDRSRIVAVMPVYVYGRFHPHLYNGNFASWHGLSVVEDYAEAHGTEKQVNYTARAGHAKCWSFYQNKIVAGEEGGAVWFSDVGLAKITRELRSLGFGPNQDYVHRPRGCNYRLANRLADPIRVSIADYEQNVGERWRSFDEYAKQMWHERVYFRPRPEAPWVFDLSVRWMTYDGQNRLVSELKNSGIAARHGFKPMSQQSEFRRDWIETDPEVDRLSRETFYLPLVGLNNVTLSIGTQEKAAKIVNRVVSALL